MTREDYLELLGPLPAPAPLDPRVLESVDCGLFIREKIEYSAESGERIPAYLCLPKKTRPGSPALFCHHQHNGEYHLGKSEVLGLGGHPDQAYAKELAERGYVTLAPDALCFEERNWSGFTLKCSLDEMARRVLKGQTLLGKLCFDISAGLSYLGTRADVNPERLGFIGHSYGGRMALWAPAFDKRIKVSVSNCGCVNYKLSDVRNAGFDPETLVPSFLKKGDVEDVVRLIEPASLFILAADDDPWARGAGAMGDYVRSAFVKGAFKLKEWPGKHRFSPDMREEAYAFLDEHL